MSQQKTDQAGERTQHTPGGPSDVLAVHKQTIDNLKVQRDALRDAVQHLIESTVADGQRFSLYPTAEAWAAVDAAIAAAEGRAQ